MSNLDYIKQTRLVQEVPGVPDGERWFLWHDRKVAWKGPTKEAGQAYATDHNISIDAVELFEP